nr:hypothetical protein [Tanacetum cinerariifolium]
NGSMFGLMLGGLEKTQGTLFVNELTKRVGEGVLAREVPSSFPSLSDERRMVDQRRMRKKWKTDLFSCHNPFESFALIERKKDTWHDPVKVIISITTMIIWNPRRR